MRLFDVDVAEIATKFIYESVPETIYGCLESTHTLEHTNQLIQTFIFCPIGQTQF